MVYVNLIRVVLLFYRPFTFIIPHLSFISRVFCFFSRFVLSNRHSADIFCKFLPDRAHVRENMTVICVFSNVNFCGFCPLLHVKSVRPSLCTHGVVFCVREFFHIRSVCVMGILKDRPSVMKGRLRNFSQIANFVLQLVSCFFTFFF
jgi:uncharacterized membrane protein